MSDAPTVSRWISPDGTPPQLHDMPAARGPLSLNLTPVPTPRGANGCQADGLQGRVALVVHADIVDAAPAAVAAYEQTLAREGHTVVRAEYRDGSAAELRAMLAELYAEPASLAGALLIGDIPYVVYEMLQDWDGGGPIAPVYDDFPCDLYFMDLDGEWADTTCDGLVQPGNGKLDSHTGARGLEIWVGRIKTDTLGALGSPVELFNSYVEKRNAFSAAPASTDTRGLVYNDDDWSCLAQMDAARLATLYGPAYADVVAEAEQTTAPDYRDDKLTTPYEFISLRSHGYFGGHGFYRDSRTVFEHVYAREYYETKPTARFYSLFVCSGCDYTRNGYLGGAVSLAPDTPGLLAIGSTKTGGMFDEDTLFDALSEHESFGSAFCQWFNHMLDTRDATECETWFYGMVLIGDASLAPSLHTPEPGGLLSIFVLGIVWRQTRPRSS
jgi:hypothetical protein